jgi:hypothetical protein
MPKQRGFRPGQSGNPAGRPKGARNRTTLAAESILEGQAAALTQKAVDLALAGDPIALKLCLERLVPPRKERTVSFPIPAMSGPADAQAAIGSILNAVAAGHITPSEAASLVQIVQEYRRSQEAKPKESGGGVALRVEFVEPPRPAEGIRLLAARQD